MTNFFLSGGGLFNLRHEIQYLIKDQFSKIVTPKVMLLNFASFDYRIKEPNILQNANYLTGLLGDNVSIRFIRNSYDAYRVPRDIKIENVDIIVVPGGDGDLIMSQMKHFYGLYNWRDVFSNQNKLVIGSSAGTNVWSKYYYSNDNQKCQDGLGTLEIKTMCHFDIRKYDKLQKLLSYKEDTPVYPIYDDSFIILSI